MLYRISHSAISYTISHAISFTISYKDIALFVIVCDIVCDIYYDIVSYIYYDKWTVEELNQILLNILVSSGGHLRTFGAIQWECKLYRGRPKARCYPFNTPKSRIESTQICTIFLFVDNGSKHLGTNTG